MEQCTLVKDMLCNEIAKHCDQLTIKMLMSTCKELREYEGKNTNDLYTIHSILKDTPTLFDFLRDNSCISFSLAKIYPSTDNPYLLVIEYNNKIWETSASCLLDYICEYQRLAIFKHLYSILGDFLLTYNPIIDETFLNFHRMLVDILYNNKPKLSFVKYLVSLAINTGKYVYVCIPGNLYDKDLVKMVNKMHKDPTLVEIIKQLPFYNDDNLLPHIHSLFQE